MSDDRIVAVGLLTRRDLEALGPTFKSIWPVEEAPAFLELLKAIDQAEDELREPGLWRTWRREIGSPRE